MIELHYKRYHFLLNFLWKYILTSLFGILLASICFLITSLWTSERNVEIIFYALAIFALSIKVALYKIAIVGQAGLLESLIEALPKIKKSKTYENLEELLSVIIYENVVHTIASIFVIGSFWLLYKILAGLFGPNPKLFNRIPIRYVVDIGNLFVLSELIFSLVLQRIRKNWEISRAKHPKLYPQIIIESSSEFDQQNPKNRNTLDLGFPPISTTLAKKIVTFLLSIPNIQDSNTQKALIYGASLDAELQHQITFSVPAMQFFELLVQILSNYGTLKDGRNALKAVLESAKNYVGQDKREYCDNLIQELQYD